MRKLLPAVYTLILLTGIIALDSCKKEHGSEPPPVITPTVNPLPHSVVAYLVTPTDQKIDYEYYKVAKSAILNVQAWYKTQMGNNKTFLVNPVVLDTITGLHPSNWYSDDNGPSVSGDDFFAFNNVKYELRQLLGSKYDSSLYTYAVFVAANIPDETHPRGLLATGTNTLEGLEGSTPNYFLGMDGHAFGHAFGLPEVAVPNPDGIMSEGFSKYPNCVLKQADKDSLNASPFFLVQ